MNNDVLNWLDDMFAFNEITHPDRKNVLVGQKKNCCHFILIVFMIPDVSLNNELGKLKKK